MRSTASDGWCLVTAASFEVRHEEAAIARAHVVGPVRLDARRPPVVGFGPAAGARPTELLPPVRSVIHLRGHTGSGPLR
jgi:hypothetical protein